MGHKPTERQARRAFEHGSSGATADLATDSTEAIEQHRHGDAAPARPAKPLRRGEKPDQLAERAARTEDRQEALLDEAIEETFPGSDPISPKHIT